MYQATQASAEELSDQDAMGQPSACTAVLFRFIHWSGGQGVYGKTTEVQTRATTARPCVALVISLLTLLSLKP